MYRKQGQEVHTFDETEGDHGYAETDPTGRYGRVSFSLYIVTHALHIFLLSSFWFLSYCTYFYKLP